MTEAPITTRATLSRTFGPPWPNRPIRTAAPARAPACDPDTALRGDPASSPTRADLDRPAPSSLRRWITGFGRRRAAAPDPVAVPERQGPIGQVIAFLGIAGGVGATTLAVNLAWEIANTRKSRQGKVCLIDLDLQRGAIGSYLNLPPHRGLLEAWDGAMLAVQNLGRCIQSTQSGLFVITAPAELVPADLLGDNCIDTLITFSRTEHDITILDLPGLIPRWVDRILKSADFVFVITSPEVRSARQLAKLLTALRDEPVQTANLRIIENKSPSWKTPLRRWNARRLREALGLKNVGVISDYGSEVSIANDQGLPMSAAYPRHPMARQIRRILSAAQTHPLSGLA